MALVVGLVISKVSKVSFIISKAIALQLDYKSRLHNTHKKTTNIMKIANSRVEVNRVIDR